MQYKGYEVEPLALALPSGLYAANLIIENHSSPLGASFRFDELDYFFEADHAIAYAWRWARLWIDQRNKRLTR
ncbi:ATPase involved in DNA repair [Candidatus Paraburkholderia calva]|nr:ATPase involved in DNA repair [Candidatus Paraburkholderia calva]